ncbi:MAG: UV DNA damage repair endonuclease UvsE [Tissierellia bacterium]|nr:UV DNA damage repair endonuclease UvsE [Tissierellia bacterium]
MNRNNIRIGYACLNKDIGRSYKSCRLNKLTEDKWIDIIEYNLKTLDKMIDYNIEKDICLLRISSDLIPFGGLDLGFEDWAIIFKDSLAHLKEKIKGKLRISLHPGQYTLLNSPRSDVVRNSIYDLNYYNKLIKSLGGDSKNKIVIHIGGVYGDKDKSLNRFIQNIDMLSEDILEHLVIENDDRSYSIDDLMNISDATGIPVIFDLHHHLVLPPKSDKTITDWIEIAGKSWDEIDGIQIIHYSTQAENKRKGAHSNTIKLSEFLDSIKYLPDYPLDIMLEVKDKNRSAEKITAYLNSDIGALEDIWAKNKYNILSKSQNSYKEIRNLLKDKQNTDFEKIISIIEDSLIMEESKSNSINAAQHIWGYFKNSASEKEKSDFINMINNYRNGDNTEKDLKKFLKKLLRKYPNEYLERSYYFEY